jgi:glycosyltransferase involved in cell wall biosynthesis
VSSRPKVALASVGDARSPATWSGITAGVFGALQELGVDARPLDLLLPRGFEQAMLAGAAAPTRNRYDAHGAALTMSIRSLLARRRLRDAELDGVIQIGTTFTMPAGVPYVTLEDMTLRQGGATHPVFSRMSARGIESWESRRAQIYRCARMCAVASRWAADSLHADYGLPRESVAVVGFGANYQVQEIARAWLPPRFLFIGIDWERKGGPILLRGFARVRKACPDAVLDIVGGHPPLHQSGVNAHGVLLQTRLADRDLMAQLLGRATCLVMPSVLEPFGIVHVEAAAAGIPSIVSGEGGAREVIGPDGGAVVDPRDEDGLFEAMLTLADPVAARHMGEAARRRAPLYTWTRVAERLLRALGLPAPDGRTLSDFL